MSVLEKSTTFKIEWQVANCNAKSHEIELEEGLNVCCGLKSSVLHHVVYLVFKSSQPPIFDISEVLISTCVSPDQRKRMNRVSTEGPNSVYCTELTECSTPLTLSCWISVKMVESVRNYSYQLRDDLLTKDLWMTTKNASLTDVHFQIGQLTKRKAFFAHRCILSARSSVFASLFEKEQSSDVCNITIDDVTPDAFKHFLRFIYTGQLKASAMSNLIELQALADRYQIATLQKLCRQPIQEMNASELTSLILSINNHQSVTTKLDSGAIFGKAFNNRLTHVSPLLMSSDVNSVANTKVGFLNSTSGVTYNASQDKSNIFFGGSALTPAASNNSDFSFPKFNQATGPITFNFGNRTPASNGASPVIALQPPTKFMSVPATPSTSCSSKGQFSGISSTPTSNEGVGTSSEVPPIPIHPSTSSIQTPSKGSCSSSFTFKSTTQKQHLDTESVTLKAAFVSAAVSRLRMIFDELLGSVEVSILGEEAYSKEPLVVPPPSPEANLQKKYFISPSKLSEWTSPLKISPSVKFSTASVIQDSQVGEIPTLSPTALFYEKSRNTNISEQSVSINFTGAFSSSHTELQTS